MSCLRRLGKASFLAEVVFKLRPRIILRERMGNKVKMERQDQTRKGKRQKSHTSDVGVSEGAAWAVCPTGWFSLFLVP